MTRYLLLVHVRPEGSLGQFDPQSLTVNATDDATALAVAGAVAEERGWECQRAEIIRREPPFQPGQRVSVFLRCAKRDVAGTIVRANSDGSYVIRWDKAPDKDYVWDADLLHRLKPMKGT